LWFLWINPLIVSKADGMGWVECRLLWHGHQVMYRQLEAWMVYGLLQDRHQEFFVSRQQGAEGTANNEHPTEAARLADWHSGFCVSLVCIPFTSSSCEACLISE
jgi:hypothetical protein